MTLLHRVVPYLESRHVQVALIGAAALAAHGVSRSTTDIDLLTTDPRVLDSGFWAIPESVEVRRGDVDDPLAGVVRISAAAEATVDLVVGRFAWQSDVVMAATRQSFESTSVPIVSATGLILMKLYAGGPQDCWDIEQLLAIEPVRLRDSVEASLGQLPARCVKLWQRILADRGDR